MSHSDPDTRACRSCGCAPCVNPTFCSLCRDADRRVAAEGRKPRILQCQLMSNVVSFERAWHELNDHRPTPQATLEAIKHSVRSCRWRCHVILLDQVTPLAR
jgi:hypothetical protein